MTKTALLLILLSVSITAVAQIVLKAGMSGAAVQRSLAMGLGVRAFLAIFSDPLVLLGLALYLGSAVVWLIVLSRTEVSLAYPFVAIGFVLTAVLGRFFFHDALSTARIAGTFLIFAGVVLLARS